MRGMILPVLLLTVGGIAGQTAARPPNILLILTDDQGYHDLSCQGASDLRTPNIDSIAAAGVRFTAGYVTSPQCAPSRAGLMTGLSPNRFGFTDNNSQHGLPPAEVLKIIPEYLQQAGYTTGVIGKWHIGNLKANQLDPAAAPQESERFVMLPGNHPAERGFDYLLLHNAGMAHYFPYRADGKKWMTDRDREYRLEQKLESESSSSLLDNLPADTYLTDYFSEQGAGFVRRNRDTPWFLFLSYNAPHTPMVARPDKLQKHAHIKDPGRRQLVAMMDSLDEGVGQVLDALVETGQLQNTLIWYLSDNGGPTHMNHSRNDPFSGRKGDMHEGGIRVPFLVALPGTIPAGQVIDEPVSAMDILPTSVAFAGGSVSPLHEGRDLGPWLRGLEPAPLAEIFWAWRQLAAVRLGTLKETRNGKAVSAIDGSRVPGHIFSDLRDNPAELPAKALSDPQQKQRLATRLDAWLQQLEEDQKKLTPPLRHP